MQATISHSEFLPNCEMYRYYRPSLHPITSESLAGRHQSSSDISPDGTATTLQGNSALAAFAKLVAWRLNANRAIISLIDRKYQYLLADSKAIDHRIDDVFNNPLQESWPGSANVSIDDLPCGKTVTPPPILDCYSLFVVQDLSKDIRFGQLPFVSGPPFMRFYAGTPIQSPKGVNIGSLFILDEVIRPGLTSDQQQFLGETAKGVMQSIEMARAASECRRRVIMGHGLSALFKGDSTSIDAPKIPSPMCTTNQGTGEARNFGTADASNKNNMQSIDLSLPLLDIQHSHKDTSRVESRPKAPYTSLAEPTSHSPTTHAKETESWADSPNMLPKHREIDTRLKAFNRAAEILHGALQIDDRGGVVFLHNGVTANNVEPFNASPRTSKDISSSERSDDLESRAGALSTGITKEQSPFLSKETRTDLQTSLPGSRTLEDDTVILGSCTASSMKLRNEEGASSLLLFHPIKRKAIAKLADLYPQGMLWSNEDLDASSAEEEHHATDSRGGAEKSGILGVSDANFLLTHFPGDSEVPFCVTFGHCVMGEIAKLDTIVANQQKQDFISSISHELRSPLHGILASVEFLGETRCDVFQKSLVDTVDSCGRTLLDTINHVLDFSKINSFETNQLEVFPQYEQVHEIHSANSEENAASIESRSGALLNIYAEINVAAVCEEVVEGLCAGRHFRGTSSIDFTDITAGAGGRNSISKSTGNHVFPSEPGVSLGNGESAVEVLLDIQNKDWRFTTQPGALRRVIMNIVGNALKYTEHGWVKIKLEAQDLNEDPQLGEQEHAFEDVCMITLTVTDSGKGISEEFLRTRLYTAFAQEDVLAPGTGLGLSLVQSIVAMLQGTVDVQSQVERGTEVKVCLPLRRARQNIEKLASSTMIGEIPRDGDDSIAILCRLAKGKTIELYGFDSNATSRSKAMGETLAHYVTEWFGLTRVATWLPSSQADILIVDEVEMPALLAHGPKFPGSLAGPLLVILCNDAVRYGQTSVYASGGGVIEFVTKPIGPYKLAKALGHCLIRAIEARRTVLDITAPIDVADTATVDADIKIFPQTASDETRENKHEAIFSSADYDSVSKAGKKVHRSGSNSNKTLTSQTPKSWITTPTILPVDDNKINLTLLETFMRKRQYSNVRSASNGQHAVNAVEQSNGYDIIFMDISMPILNGFEATRAIRKPEADRHERAGDTDHNYLRSLIVVLTGLVSTRDRAEAFEAGVDIYMTKPVSLRDVRKLLDHWELDGRDGLRQ